MMKNYKRIAVKIVASFLLVVDVVAAKEISGVSIPAQITASDDTKLVLNGAGIRTKFIFDVYIGALYLQNKVDTPSAIFNDKGPKRILMHFLYDEVSKEKLINGWVDGFKANLSQQEFKELEERLQQFNELFVTVKSGDQILLEYIPDKGTEVSVNESVEGVIQGEDFNTALLKVWLGDEPADSSLKDAMLGSD